MDSVKKRRYLIFQTSKAWKLKFKILTIKAFY